MNNKQIAIRLERKQRRRLRELYISIPLRFVDIECETYFLNEKLVELTKSTVELGSAFKKEKNRRRKKVFENLGIK